MTIAQQHGAHAVEKSHGMQEDMKARGYWQLAHVADVELVDGLKGLVARGAWTDAQVVAHLAELESRRLHLRVNKSLFAYCQQDLGLSQNEAHYRIVAARIARKYPVVFELLERRKLHLTALALIRYYITTENHRELLDAVAGKTKEQILRLLATRAPRPDAISRIRKVPIPANSVAAGPTGSLEPLSATASRLELHLSEPLRAKLELAADLMSHSNPGRDLAVVVERGLDLLIADVQKRRFGQTPHPRSGAASPSNRPASPRPHALHRSHIPHETRRKLVARDGLGCSHVGEDGQRCGATAFLQLHHEQAWAKGGSDDLQNLRFLCAAHNALLASDEFGTHIIETERALTHRAKPP